VYSHSEAEIAGFGVRKYTQKRNKGAHETRKYLFTIVGGSILINPAFAQEQTADEVPEVIVTGLRASIESGAGDQARIRHIRGFRSRRRTSAPFPDKSVAEALQRVPGITVSRLQSSDDSNHFSAEPATVLVRGLTFVRTEFNGRDSFSADGYRGLNFNDVSPELMSGVDTLQEPDRGNDRGRIAGVVNLRTRMPFDSEGEPRAPPAGVTTGIVR
jgi:outer membrane receptor protein involved in Fe transport